MDLVRYGDFRPTTLDVRGLGCPDRQDWLVVPCSRTRDSGPLAESNFETALGILGGESETVECHRFGHWGPGWFEVILAHPSREADVARIVDALANYPVLSDDDLSRREDELAWNQWARGSYRDLVCELAHGFGLSDAAQDLLLAFGPDALHDFHSAHADGWGYVFEGSDCVWDFRYVRDVPRSDVAALLCAARKVA